MVLFTSSFYKAVLATVFVFILDKKNESIFNTALVLILVQLSFWFSSDLEPVKSWYSPTLLRVYIQNPGFVQL